MEALCQLSYSPERLATIPRGPRPSQQVPRSGGRGVGPIDLWHVGVQALDLVELPDLCEEHVHDDVAVVDQHPLVLADALASERRAPGLLPGLDLDLVDQRPHEPAVRRADDNEVFGDAE